MGPLSQPNRRLPHSESIQYDIAVAIEIDGDGMISRWHDYYDLQSIVNELRS
jgi:hypothetical protein